MPPKRNIMKQLAFTHVVARTCEPDKTPVAEQDLGGWNRRQTSFEYGGTHTGLGYLRLGLAFIWTVYVLCSSESFTAAGSYYPIGLCEAQIIGWTGQS